MLVMSKSSVLMPNSVRAGTGARSSFRGWASAALSAAVDDGVVDWGDGLLRLVMAKMTASTIVATTNQSVVVDEVIFSEAKRNGCEMRSLIAAPYFGCGRRDVRAL
jgi:hypothetical protein